MELPPRVTRRISGSAFCLLLLALCLLGLPSRAQETRGSVDWILVLDTSASMRGAGGAADIFDNVKDAISGFIRSTKIGDTVTLYTFDRDTTLRSNIRITGELDKRDLLKAVSDVSSNGDRTHTGKAIHDALERAAEMEGHPDAAERTVSIVLFTDGLEDVRGIPNAVSIPSNINMVPKNQPYMFFVSLGAQEHERQLETFVKDPAMGNRGEVVRDAGALHIAEVMDGIRKKIETPRPPKEVNLKVEPLKLDFGQIEPGDTTGSQTVNITADIDRAVRVTLGAGSEGISLVNPAGPLEVRAGKSSSAEISLKSAAEMANGQRTLTLTLTPDSATPSEVIKAVNVEATVNVVRVPLWRKILKYLVLLLILLCLVIAVISVIKGEPPWIWLPGLIERATLEGELQVLQPRPARVEDEFISLTQRHAKSVLLSSLIPGGASGDSDAELSIAKEKGEPVVKLQRTRGTIYVNKIEVANTNLYNDDIIELGGTKLLYNWVNHDRPAEFDEGSLT